MIIEHNWGSHREAYITEQYGKGIICAEIQREDPNTCILHDLFVTPTHQRSGYGRKLMRKALEYATRNGCRYAILFVAPDAEQWVQPWYERLGFKEYAIDKKGRCWLKKAV